MNNNISECNTLLDHVWTNVLENNSKAGKTEAY